MFSIMAQNQGRGWQNFEKKTGEALAETAFFSKFCPPRSRFWEPKLKTWSRQIMFYVIYPKPMEILGKFENCGKFWNIWKILGNFGFFLKILKIMENLGKFRIIISKVGGKLWRKEGYIPSWRFDQTSYILFIKLLTFHPQYCTWTATIKQDLGDSSPNRPTFTLLVIKIYQKVRTGVYDCSRRYEIQYGLHGV